MSDNSLRDLPQPFQAAEFLLDRGLQFAVMSR